jgi:hypothetical protein
MQTQVALLAFASLAACNAAPRSPAAAPEENEMTKPTRADAAARCPLLVAFGSYAMGIDGETLRRVEQLFDGDPAVTGVERSRQGREGEVTLCASVASETDRDRLFDAVSALFPRRPRGPLSVRTDAGRVFEANNAT